ncbi:MAG: hypothetical protein M1445_14880 [Bacteroidetes bacterium]|nr:hypothetical protein [Bacteroidota bacterium]MCL6102771.1 hypothetical protein [Bacteroidota bacterium]
MKKYTDEEIVEMIKTVEDAERLCGKDEKLNLNLTDTDKSVEAYKKLRFVIRQLNQGWVPDWSNLSQRKWFNWFYFSTGVYCRFSYSYSYNDAASATARAGSRLCFKSRALAEYAAVQFKSLYEDYLLN